MAAQSPAIDALAVDAGPSVHNIPRRSVASWVLYDLANTCFSLGVVTLYLPKLVRSRLGNGVPRADGVVGTLAAVAAADRLRPGTDPRRDQRSGGAAPPVRRRPPSCAGATFFLAQATEGLSFLLFVVASPASRRG